MSFSFADKGKLKNRLLVEGRWRDFTKIRERLKRGNPDTGEIGLKPIKAWEAAAKEIYPEGWEADVPRKVIKPGEDYEGEVGLPDKVKKPEKAKEEEKPEVNIPLAIFAIVQAKSPAKFQEDIEWVYGQLPIPLGSIDFKTAPSTGAIGLLKWAHGLGNSEFYKSVWSKLLPSKQEIDQSSRFSDDEREHFELVNKLRREALLSVANQSASGGNDLVCGDVQDDGRAKLTVENPED